MTKRMPILYPEFNSDEGIKAHEKVSWKNIGPKHKLKLGKPSNRYYQYIYTSLNFREHSLHDLRDLLQFEGMEVFVRSVLKMNNGESYAVLRKCEDRPFSADIQHIYAEIKKSYSSKEILEL